MKIGIYGINFDPSFDNYIQELFNQIEEYGWEVTIYEPFLEFLNSRIKIPASISTFDKTTFKSEKASFIFSLGGDGTFLDTAKIVNDSGVPVLGINTGRLGFLASTHKEDIKASLEFLKQGKFRIQKRSLLCLVEPKGLFGDNNFALNELTVHKKDSSSMITIHTYINDLYLNSYWADGLIISTPTGSTAYSLSCGGPILVPGAKDHIITPIAPHNLNVRPVVVPDDRVIRLKIEGREGNYLVSLDSKSVTIEPTFELIIKKADFHINCVVVDDNNFLNTMRNKMLWGLDKRN
jgi:NAD+ kinase